MQPFQRNILKFCSIVFNVIVVLLYRNRIVSRAHFSRSSTHVNELDKSDLLHSKWSLSFLEYSTNLRFTDNKQIVKAQKIDEEVVRLMCSVRYEGKYACLNFTIEHVSCPMSEKFFLFRFIDFFYFFI